MWVGTCQKASEIIRSKPLSFIHCLSKSGQHILELQQPRNATDFFDLIRSKGAANFLGGVSASDFFLFAERSTLSFLCLSSGVLLLLLALALLESLAEIRADDDGALVELSVFSLCLPPPMAWF